MNTSLLSKKKQLLRENKELTTKIKAMRKQLQEVTYPFDFTGTEPADNQFWKFANALIARGYLTKDLKPTQLSIRRDYIRYNDGTTKYDLHIQPELLFTEKFMTHLQTTLPNPFEETK